MKYKFLAWRVLLQTVFLMIIPCFFMSTVYASTLPNGLTLVSFEVKTASPLLAGTTAHIEMTLKNISGTPIKFSNEFGIFVASRHGDLGDANNRDFGHGNKGLVLGPEKTVTVKASRILDSAGKWWFWPGFNINGQWGPFRWMEKSIYVYASREEAKLFGKVLNVSEILANPSLFDQKMVNVKGRALIVRKKKSKKGQPWNLISFFDIKNNKAVINVFGPGHAKIGNGDIIQVTGIFKAKSKRGRYTFDNEIETRSEQIVMLEQAKLGSAENKIISAKKMWKLAEEKAKSLDPGAVIVNAKYNRGDRDLNFRWGEFIFYAPNNPKNSNFSIQIMDAKITRIKNAHYGNLNSSGIDPMPNKAVKVALKNGLDAWWRNYPNAGLYTLLVPRKYYSSAPGTGDWVWKIESSGPGLPEDVNFFINAKTFEFLGKKIIPIKKEYKNITQKQVKE